MKKQMRVSKAVDALRLPALFIIESMAAAEAKPQYTGQIDVQTYAHSSGNKLCIAVFENEILAFTEVEIASGEWLKMGRNETMGIADVQKLQNYLRTGSIVTRSSRAQALDWHPYAATYSDVRGSESTTIFNDGQTLRLQLRGVEFAGDDFDSLSSQVEATDEQLAQFTLSGGQLCSCRIECEVPIPVIKDKAQFNGALSMDLVLGDPKGNGGIDREELRLILRFADQQYSSSGKSGWFEDELLDIQHQLPSDVFMKACINCMFSDYSPAGHGLFGYMRCFRNLKS